MIGIIPVNKLPYKYNEHDYIKITHNEPPLPLVTSLALVLESTGFAPPNGFIQLISGGNMFTYFGMHLRSEHYLIPKITFSHGWSKSGENMSTFELNPYQIRTIKITEKYAHMYRVSFVVSESSDVHYFTTNDYNDFKVKTLHTLNRNYDTLFLPHAEKRTTNLYLKLFSTRNVNIDSVEIYYKND